MENNENGACTSRIDRISTADAIAPRAWISIYGATLDRGLAQREEPTNMEHHRHRQRHRVRHLNSHRQSPPRPPASAPSDSNQ